MTDSTRVIAPRGTAGSASGTGEGNDPRLTRRSFVEWMGKAVVLGLGSELMAACAARSVQTMEDASTLQDGQEMDQGPDGEDGYGFSPGAGDGELFEGWPERTVDAQDLTSILESWSLRIDGMVEEPRTLRFEEIVALERQQQVTDFHCVEGWSVLDVPWIGVHLGALSHLARPMASATHITIHTLGGTYNESLALDVAREPRSMLAYGIDDATIPLKHGFPLRFVVPRLLGYKNPKYVTRLEYTDTPYDGFWVRAGYPYDGLVPESRLRPGKY